MVSISPLISTHPPHLEQDGAIPLQVPGGFDRAAMSEGLGGLVGPALDCGRK